MTASFVKLCEPSHIEEVALTREGQELVLRLSLMTDHDGEPFAFTFRDVRDVRFRAEQVDLSNLVTMVRQDVSDRGWDQIRFCIKDYEEEFISFYCSNYSRA